MEKVIILLFPCLVVLGEGKDDQKTEAAYDEVYRISKIQDYQESQTQSNSNQGNQEVKSTQHSKISNRRLLLKSYVQQYYRFNDIQILPYLDDGYFHRAIIQTSPGLSYHQIQTLRQLHRNWMNKSVDYLLNFTIYPEDYTTHDYCPNKIPEPHPDPSSLYDPKMYIPHVSCLGPLDINCIIGSRYFKDILIFYVLVQLLALMVPFLLLKFVFKKI